MTTAPTINLVSDLAFHLARTGAPALAACKALKLDRATREALARELYKLSLVGTVEQRLGAAKALGL